MTRANALVIAGCNAGPRRKGLGTQELLVRYVHERYLYRLSRSHCRDRLILKGGMLLIAFEARRATQDIDVP